MLYEVITEVFVLYRDIRTYGFQEDYYKEARDKGVKFIRFDLDHRPVVREEAGKTIVRAHDFILGQDIDIEADCVALSVITSYSIHYTKLYEFAGLPIFPGQNHVISAFFFCNFFC